MLTLYLLNVNGHVVDTIVDINASTSKKTFVKSHFQMQIDMRRLVRKCELNHRIHSVYLEIK